MLCSSKNKDGNKVIHEAGISSTTLVPIHEHNHKTKGSASNLEVVTQPSVHGTDDLDSQVLESELGRKTKEHSPEPVAKDYHLSWSQESPNVPALDIKPDEKTKTSGVDEATGQVGSSKIQSSMDKYSNPEYMR
jgi:hypothetical protein